MTYSDEVSGRILEGFQDKGWNLYAYVNGIPEDEIIRHGSADGLSLDVHYVLLPFADNPADYKQVMDAMEALAVKLDRKIPTISVGGLSYPMTGITLRESDVKVHSPQGVFVPYQEFLDALDSVVDVFQ